MISATQVDHLLLNLLLRRGTWVERGIPFEEVQRRWPATGVRLSDLTNVLERAQRGGLISISESTTGRINIRFTSKGFEIATAAPAGGATVDRGITFSMMQLGMRLGIHVPTAARLSGERRQPTRH